jgi:hypothetical protein
MRALFEKSFPLYIHRKGEIKMKKYLCILAMFASPAFALLSPLNESLVELQALLKDPAMTAKLKTSETIQEIVKVEQGYLVITDNYQMQVDLTYQPMNRPGPQKFTLKFQDPVPLQSDSEE